MDTPFIVSQIFASLSLVMGLLSFQFKDRKHILRCWAASATLSSIHFFLLENYPATFLVILTGSRFLVASIYLHHALMYIYLAAACIGFTFTYQSPISFLAFFATFLGTIGSFQKSDKTIRTIMFICASSWLLHNYLIKSPVAVLMEILFMASNVRGYLKFYGKKKEKE